MKTIILIAFAALASAQTQEPKVGASIQGEVVDPSGKAIAGAAISAHSSSVDGVVKNLEQAGAVSDKAGRFTITGLKGGPYVLCASVPRSAYLDPCYWSEPPLVRVAAGQASESVKVQLVPGVRLKLRLEDPGMKLAPFKRGTGPSMMPYVELKNGRSFPLGLVSSDIDAHDYELAVPAETDLYVSFAGSDLKVADEKGAAIEQSKPVAVKSDAAASVQQLRFRLSAPPKQ